MENINALKTYCFDLDETLCKTFKTDYKKSQPIKERINFVNRLYDKGHTIIIDSARGSGTGTYWTKYTKDQLDRWGLKYHKVRCGTKFAADIYIDDKAFNSEKYFS